MKHFLSSRPKSKNLNTKDENALLRIANNLANSERLTLPILFCFFTGQMPDSASPMPRNPAPNIGMEFGDNFSKIFEKALSLNQAVHDGAIMLGRPISLGYYKIAGWSYRLHPPSIRSDIQNKGSAFNSCIAMSTQKNVDYLLLISKSGIYIFENGKVIQ